MRYVSFDSWSQLLDHIKAGYPLYYQAPLDYQPVQVTSFIRKDGKLRIAPMWHSEADPFTADHAHLDRFRRNVSKLNVEVDARD